MKKIDQGFDEARGEVSAIEGKQMRHVDHELESALEAECWS